MLREERRAARMSMGEAGKVSGQSARSIQLYEKGDTSPTLDKLAVLCTAYSVPMPVIVQRGQARIAGLPVPVAVPGGDVVRTVGGACVTITVSVEAATP